MNEDTKRILLQVVSDEDLGLLELKYIQGYSYEEIARLTGITSSTLRSRVRRARMEIQAAYRSEDLA